MLIRRNCIVCEKPLVSAGSSHGELEMEITDPPDNGIYLTSGGNWGSTVLDEFGRGHIEVSMCDECLKDRAAKGYVYYIREIKGPKALMVDIWEPQKDYESNWFDPATIVETGYPAEPINE